MFVDILPEVFCEMKYEINDLQVLQVDNKVPKTKIYEIRILLIFNVVRK